MLAVLGAMEEETVRLRARLTDVREETVARIRVARGSFDGTEIILAQCGIGKVNAAICTQMIIDRYGADRLLFCGVAGGLAPNMRPGDIVVASHLIQYDMDLTAFGRRRGEIPGLGRLLESDPELVQLAAAAFDEAFPGSDGPGPSLGPNLMIGTVASADRFIKDRDEQRRLQREFSALATEMEGAAAGQTCYLNDVPFVVVRAISDGASQSAQDEFSSNLSRAAANAARLMEKLIPAAVSSCVA